MRYLLPSPALFLIAALSVAAADPPAPEAAEKLTKFLGNGTVDHIKRIESAEVFRVGKLADKDAKDVVGLRVIQGESKALTAEQTERLRAALLNPDTYLRGDSKGTTAAVGFRCKVKDGGTVEVSGCVSKGNVQVVVRDAAGKVIKQGDVRGFRDDKSAPFRALAAELFPDDADIQKYKPAAEKPAPKPAESK